MKALAAACLLLAACATIPEPTGGGDNLPSANAGPFRALVTGELSMSLSLVAPWGIDDSNTYSRDIAVLRADDTSMAVFAYVAAAASTPVMPASRTTPTSTILRYGAQDARSFDFHTTEKVLGADAPWEGGVVGSPAAIRVGAQIFLYYAAKGGIGLAKSADSHTFTKVAGPVLSPASGGWEHGAAPASPGVVQLADGTFRMFYEVATSASGTAIGEASSSDGVTWTRVGTGPALAASGGGDAGPSPWDAASVGSPFPILAVSGDDRSILRVYYGAVDVNGLGSIGLAARYGSAGTLSRSTAPVFGTATPYNPHEPCVVVFGGTSLIYVTELDSTIGGQPAVAVGVAPGTAVLPLPIPE